MSDLLSIRNLRKVFGTWSQTYAVDGVTFSMPETPSIMNLVGESGSGKSTIARIVLGLEKPTSGTVSYKGADIFRQNAAWQRQFRREVQVVFQDPYSAYNPIYKIERVFNVPIRRFKLAGSRAEAREMIEASLEAVDLRPQEVLGKYPHQLSGGQRQRVMLARLHLIRPRLIIADEPISMIDASMQASFLNILLDFRDRLGISTLFITHDLSTAQYLGGDILVLYQGRVTEYGNTSSVTQRPRHPYARLLMKSIPIADPRKRWEETLPATPEVITEETERRDRCLYAERCRYAMPACWKVRPALRAADAAQASKPANGAATDGEGRVACYLWHKQDETGERVASELLETETLERFQEML